MERRVTRPAEPVTGFQQRVYTSDYTLPPGEGVSLRGVPGRQAGALAASIPACRNGTSWTCERTYRRIMKSTSAGCR